MSPTGTLTSKHLSTSSSHRDGVWTSLQAPLWPIRKPMYIHSFAFKRRSRRAEVPHEPNYIDRRVVIAYTVASARQFGIVFAVFWTAISNIAPHRNRARVRRLGTQDMHPASHLRRTRRENASVPRCIIPSRSVTTDAPAFAEQAIRAEKRREAIRVRVRRSPDISGARRTAKRDRHMGCEDSSYKGSQRDGTGFVQARSAA